MYFSFHKFYSRIFQGILENPWKILEILKYSSLALIDTSLENVHLDIALRFKVFQGQLKFPFEIFGWSSTLKILDVFRKGYLDLDWTLNFKVNFKEPWNSRLQLFSLVVIKIAFELMLLMYLSQLRDVQCVWDKCAPS